MLGVFGVLGVEGVLGVFGVLGVEGVLGVVGVLGVEGVLAGVKVKVPASLEPSNFRISSSEVKFLPFRFHVPFVLRPELLIILSLPSFREVKLSSPFSISVSAGSL